MFDAFSGNDNLGKTGREAPWEANRINEIPVISWTGLEITAGYTVSFDAIE